MGAALAGSNPSERGLLEIAQQANRGFAATVRRVREYADAARREAVGSVYLSALAVEAIAATESARGDLVAAAGGVIRLESDLPPGLWVAVPPGEMLWAVFNLIVNAAEALPEGDTIRVASGARGTDNWLSVTDDGIGMDAALRERIFEHFFTTGGPDREGLNLNSARTLVVALGGRLSVTSAPGQGTSFIIVLPAAPA